MMRVPTLFIAHGSPMSALGADRLAAGLRQIGERVRGMKAILAISAHWQTPEPLRITAWRHAGLMYDFGGFPDELYRLQYPAPGDPALAEHVAGLLRASEIDAVLENRRGLDHGAWVPLRLAWPDAATPVLELSLPDAPPSRVLELGRALRPLRDEGVLLLGTGGIVHNLGRVRFGAAEDAVDDWAASFDGWVASRVAAGDVESLLRYRSLAPHAAEAAPTTEHFDPIFATLGAAFADERPVTLLEGFELGNLSLRSFGFGLG
jgi:4,5-DOPA dioxygenase extradiol